MESVPGRGLEDRFARGRGDEGINVVESSGGKRPHERRSLSM